MHRGLARLAGAVGQGGDDLVGIHVRGRARTGLVDVDREMRVPVTGGHFGGRDLDRLGHGLGQVAQLGVDAGGSALDQAQRAEATTRHALARDREGLYGALGLRAPEGIGRHLQLAHAVIWGKGSGGWQGVASRAGGCDNDTPLPAAWDDEGGPDRSACTAVLHAPG
ncbi:hypothetical protein G6F31_018799 [Rhizopus arrhizus]|nr:hypothetical protein G6F31_018799 [Rhizopus arrhizus]